MNLSGQPMNLSRLLAPRSVVVVGATDRPGSYAAATLLNLRRAGYPGAVLGVHPHRTDVLGYPCLSSVDDAVNQLGAPADAVVIATPAASVAGYLSTAGRLGCGGAVVYAAGFGESGDRAGQAALSAAAARYCLPVLGPNANGFVSVAERAPLWGDAVTLPRSPGPIALITQSGNIGVLALAHRHGLGLHSVVSLGNAAVVAAPAVLAQLAVTDGVRAVALYLEDDGDGAALAGALALCAQSDLRVVVLKAGRSAAGREAAGAHTAALAGDHRVFAALIAEAGGVLARDPHDLIETARALAGGRRSPGRLAVLTASGGDAAITADLAADAGVPLARLGPQTRVRLGELLPHTATVTNPLDHTNLVWADTEALAAITAVLAADPDVGPVIYVQDEPPGLPPVDAAEWAATRAGAVLGARRSGVEVMLVATTPGQEPEEEPGQRPGEEQGRNQEQGRPGAGTVSGLRAALAAIAVLRRPAPDPSRLHAIARAAAQAAAQGRTGLDVTHLVAGSAPHDGAEPATRWTPGATSGWLAEHEAKAVLASARIPVPAHTVIDLGLADQAPAQPWHVGTGPTTATPTSPTPPTSLISTTTGSRAAGAAQDLGFPIVLKVSAPGLLHKSEAGALALNLSTQDDVHTAAVRLADVAQQHPGAVLLVEAMAVPGVELVVAAVRDGVVPALVIGLGGIWAEVLDDVVVVALPADPDRVVAALHRLRGAAMLTGGRGTPGLDLAAVGEIACRIGELLLAGDFALIEVNPLIVTTDGASAVDALARRRIPGLS